MVKTKQRHTEKQTANTSDPPVLAKLLEGCTEDAAEKFRALHKLASTVDTSTLGTMWKQGQIIEQLRQAESSVSSDELDPVNPVLVASSILGRDPRYVNRVGQFYRAFPSKEELEKVLSCRLRASGRPLTWAHFEQLLKLFDEDGHNGPFQKLLTKTIEKSWSPAEIENHIKTSRRVAGEEESRGGGRPIVIPPSFEGKVTRLVAQATILANNAREIYLAEQHSLLASVRNMSQIQVATNASEIRASLERIEEQGQAVRALFENLEKTQFPQVRKFVEDCEKFFEASKK